MMSQITAGNNVHPAWFSCPVVLSLVGSIYRGADSACLYVTL